MNCLQCPVLVDTTLVSLPSAATRSRVKLYPPSIKVTTPVFSDVFKYTYPWNVVYYCLIRTYLVCLLFFPNKSMFQSYHFIFFLPFVRYFTECTFLGSANRHFSTGRKLLTCRRITLLTNYPTRSQVFNLSYLFCTSSNGCPLHGSSLVPSNLRNVQVIHFPERF